MINPLSGTWRLIAWRRIAADGAISYPLGADARGLLNYASNGTMAVQISGTDRVAPNTDDPLGGSAQERAQAYSSYLAYFGTYAVQGQTVVHDIDSSLYPGWSGHQQVRPFTIDRDELVLRTPPMQVTGGTTVVNELSWAREGHSPKR
jgi:Lipocalin-like domain